LDIDPGWKISQTNKYEEYAILVYLPHFGGGVIKVQKKRRNDFLYARGKKNAKGFPSRLGEREDITCQKTGAVLIPSFQRAQAGAGKLFPDAADRQSYQRHAVIADCVL
jgi:hypothetical protein